MTELKTLKDIKIERGLRVGIKNPDDCLIDPDELVKEAIKWVKEWTKEKSTMRQDEMAYWCYMGRIHALTEFHNITEKDLKNEK